MNPSKPASPASSQVEAIRRTAKLKSVSIEHTIAAPVVTALDHILSYAFEQRASDNHFENAVPAFWPLPSALTGVRTR